MRRVPALLLLASGLLTACAPTLKQPAQQFAATTSLREGRVIVTVTNLGPSNLWLDPNTCPGKFKVEVQERLPYVRPRVEGTEYFLVDTCLTILYPPELWKVGETKVGLPTTARLAPGTYTLTAWAEPKVAPDLAGKPGGFRRVRVQAPAVVLTAP